MISGHLTADISLPLQKSLTLSLPKCDSPFSSAISVHLAGCEITEADEWH